MALKDQEYPFPCFEQVHILARMCPAAIIMKNKKGLSPLEEAAAMYPKKKNTQVTVPSHDVRSGQVTPYYKNMNDGRPAHPCLLSLLLIMCGKLMHFVDKSSLAVSRSRRSILYMVHSPHTDVASVCSLDLSTTTDPNLAAYLWSSASDLMLLLNNGVCIEEFCISNFYCNWRVSLEFFYQSVADVVKALSCNKKC
eukprot:gene7910-16194_t